MTLNLVMNTMMMKMKVVPARLTFKGDSAQEGQDSTSTSIFKNFSNKFSQSEQDDVIVHPDLANLINNSIRNDLSDYSLDEIVKQIHQPEKCDSLVKIRVNQGQ